MTEESPRRAYRMVARAEKHERTRGRIVEAMKELLMTTTYPALRVADVAAAAGVSAQTVHSHFRTKEALFLSAIGEVGRDLLERRARTAPGDLVGLVGGLVAEYERYGDVAWSLLAMERDSPAVAAALETGRDGHRAWLEESFGPLLPREEPRRADALRALYAATDVGTWKLLRRDLGSSQAQTRTVIERLVRGALREDDGDRADHPA